MTTKTPTAPDTQPSRAEAPSDLEALLRQCNPFSRYWIQDAIENGDLDEAADDFVEINGGRKHGAVALCNAICRELGVEPVYRD